jgi:hypothetical protein
MPKTSDLQSSLPEWAEKHLQIPFPTELLPPELQRYVHSLASFCGLDEGSVCMMALAVAVGSVPDSWSMPNCSGSRVGLRFNLILALPPSLTAGLLLSEATSALEVRQRYALRRAGQIDEATVSKADGERTFRFPERSNLSSPETTPSDLFHRRQTPSFRRPAFILKNPI